MDPCTRFRVGPPGAGADRDGEGEETAEAGWTLELGWDGESVIQQTATAASKEARNIFLGGILSYKKGQR